MPDKGELHELLLEYARASMAFDDERNRQASKHGHLDMRTLEPFAERFDKALQALRPKLPREGVPEANLLAIIGDDREDPIRFLLHNESAIEGALVRWPEGWRAYLFDGPKVAESADTFADPEEAAHSLVSAWADRRGLATIETTGSGNA